MNFITILAIETPAKTLMESTKEWIPFYGAVLITAITAFGNWWKGRSKTKHDQFEILMNESSEFREEMRKEREILKKEIKILETEKLALQIERDKYLKQIANYVIQLENCDNKVKLAEDNLTEAKKDLEIFQQKIAVVKEKEINQIK